MAAVQHIALVCRDRLATERFYTKHFGFRRARVFNPGRPDEFVMTRLGPVCLEFFQANQEALAARVPDERVGVRHLCFEVPKLEPKIAELKADGVEVGPIEDCSQHVEGQRICFFNDPDGNSIELLEKWEDQDNPPPL